MSDVLLDRLTEQVLVFDGANGTEFYRRGIFVNTSFEALCLTRPEVVREVHRSYVEAGAQVLTTNSFAANPNVLAKFGLGDQVQAINARAVELARECAEDGVLVAASVGPLGEIPASREVSEDDAAAMLSAQVAALVSAGPDFVHFETLSSRRDVERAVWVAAAGLGVPYAISLKVSRDGESARGESLEALLGPIAGAAHAPTAIGLNCGEGAEELLAALEVLRPLLDYPLIVQPNAGLPRTVEGRTLYMLSPEYFTTYGLRYVQLGARGVGGCCGVGPDHIRDFARSVAPVAASAFSRRITVVDHGAARREPTPMAEKSRLGAKLAAGEWVRTVELVPPRGYDLAGTLAKADRCRLAGIDAINIPDGPRASSRMSPIITAQQVLERTHIEPILHFCCRDKNLIGMQADMLGCAAAGLRNILFVTGDPPKLGDYPFASAVFDVDSVGAVKIQHNLNCGVDLGGTPVDPPTQTLIAVGADPNALDYEREVRRTREKASAGAELIITQPVFAAAPLLAFVEAIADLGLPVLAGIWPLASYRNAEFMRNEVPGVVVPDAVMARMGKAETREEQREAGIAIARESVAAIRQAVAGIQVSAPFGRVETALAVTAE